MNPPDTDTPVRPGRSSPCREWPALLDDDSAAEYLSISPSALWQRAGTGDLPSPVKLPNTRATRWRRADLDEFVATLR